MAKSYRDLAARSRANWTPEAYAVHAAAGKSFEEDVDALKVISSDFARLERTFEGDPLVIVEVEEREGREPLRTPILTNGKSVRFVAEPNPGHPGVYSVRIFTAKGARGLLLRSRRSIELSGLADGRSLLISVDPETDELLFTER